MQNPKGSSGNEDVLSGMKSIVISVINDLATDQRVHRMAGTFVRQGYRVVLLGRKLPGSLPVQIDGLADAAIPEPAEEKLAGSGQGTPEDHMAQADAIAPSPQMVRVRRFRMLFRRGPLFYAFYNLRLFLFLLFRRSPELLVSVDLDTLPASYLLSRLRSIPLLYDSHEYFTEVPELVDRPRVKRTWEKIEEAIVPRLRSGIAVSDSIAASYREKYGVDFRTIRNVPASLAPVAFTELQDTYPFTYKIIYQGALNKGRGIELMIEAMRYIPDTLLFIAGDGDIRTDLQSQVHRMKLTDRVVFPGRIPPRRLASITAQCDLGFSLEEDLGLNYRMALPNKLFDYIQARVPVLCSDLPEMAAVVKNYGVGEVCINRSPQQLGAQVREILKNMKKREGWRISLEKAARELCWEKEEKKLIEIVDELLGT